MNLIRILIAGSFLLAFVFFKIDKETFGNLEWLLLGSFVLLYFIAILLASIADEVNKEK